MAQPQAKQPQRTINFYRSYNFTDKDPVIDSVRTIVQDEDVSHADIHRMSGVTPGTLHNWFDGPTKRPQYATIAAVVRALGYDFKLVRTNEQMINGKTRKAHEPQIIKTPLGKRYAGA